MLYQWHFSLKLLISYLDCLKQTYISSVNSASGCSQSAGQTQRVSAQFKTSPSGSATILVLGRVFPSVGEKSEESPLSDLLCPPWSHGFPATDVATNCFQAHSKYSMCVSNSVSVSNKILPQFCMLIGDNSEACSHIHTTLVFTFQEQFEASMLI